MVNDPPDEDTQTDRGSRVQRQDHVPVLQGLPCRDPLPSKEGLKLLFRHTHDGLGGAGSKKLNESGGGLDEAAYRLKSLHSPGMNLVPRSGNEVARVPEEPPALPHPKEEEFLEVRLRDPEPLLQITEQIGALLLPCQYGP